MSVEAFFPNALARKLADYLHYTHCHWNHTDGCGYGYMEWSKVTPKQESDFKDKARAYKVAEDLIDTFGAVSISNFFTVHNAIDRMHDKVMGK